MPTILLSKTFDDTLFPLLSQILPGNKEESEEPVSLAGKLRELLKKRAVVRAVRVKMYLFMLLGFPTKDCFANKI